MRRLRRQRPYRDRHATELLVQCLNRPLVSTIPPSPNICNRTNTHPLRNKKWWESANIVTTIAKFGSHTPSFKDHAANIIGNSYTKTRGERHWINEYYDDEGWWALAWIASYDLTGDSKYLDAAKDLFQDMTTGWTTPCGGGIWWDKQNRSIAAISNELFLSVAAHLANRVPDGEEKDGYISWAEKEWNWFSASGIINSENLINDGIDQGTCENDGKNVWSYNQGVILGGLAELAIVMGSGKYTDEAKRIADTAMQKLTEGGILTEKVDNLDEQGAQFKGAFVRGLAALNEQAPEQRFKEFLTRNADSAWQRGKEGEIIGPNWAGEDQGEAGTTSHASGVDVLVAAAQAV